MNRRLTVFALLSLLLFSLTFGGTFLDSVEENSKVAYQRIAASVGVSVGIAPNEFSKLAQEVTDKQEELEARELAVAERERQLERRENISSLLSLEWYVTILAFILLLLVLLNFYLDWRRFNV